MKRLCLLLLLAPFALTGCGGTPPGSSPSSSPNPPSSTSASVGPGATRTDTSPPGNPNPFTVRYGWAVPSTRVTVDHTIAVPPIPQLVEVRTGDHPRESPGYSRITFAFRNGYPAYSFSYVPRVTQDGSGDPVQLAGNSFLQIAFTPAEAHDANGRSTIAFASDKRVGYRNLVAYDIAGDFEAHVSFGLGINVAPGSDQALPIRVGEQRRVDGTYVVAFDVRAG